MKFNAQTLALNASLSLVMRAVPAKPSHPVLGNILLTADKETQRVRLAAFDLSLGIQTSFAAQVDAEGSVALPAKLFTNIVSHLPKDEVSLEIDRARDSGDNNESYITTITSTSGRYQIRGMDAKEFPELPVIEDGIQMEIPAIALKEGLSGTLFAAATEETKQVLTGIHLTIENNTIEFASTDGHRLAVVKTLTQVERTIGTLAENQEKREVRDNPEFEVTVPAKALQELEKLLGNAAPETAIALLAKDNQLVFQGNSTLTTRTLEGRYPAYRQLLPSQFQRQMQIGRLQFLTAVERVAVMSDPKHNIVRLNLDSDNQQLTLSMDAADIGSSLEVLPAQISGESLSIAFNVRYLKEAIKAIAASELKMQLNSNTSAAVLSPEVLSQNVRAASMLLMPVQMRDEVPAPPRGKTKNSSHKQEERELAPA